MMSIYDDPVSLPAVYDLDLLAQELTDALGVSCTVSVVGGTLRVETDSEDRDTIERVCGAHLPGERRQLDELVDKARAVLRGEATFTAQEAQKILAGMVLLTARR